MPEVSRKLDINLHDTSVGIWQDDPNDPTFRSEIFEPLTAWMRRRGWRVTADPEVLKRHRCISKGYRVAERGDLRARGECHGRSIEVTFWSERAVQENRNGRRYDFDKRDRAPYLDRLRMDLEARRILAWLGARAELTIRERRTPRCGAGAGELPAAAWIEQNARASGHYAPELGRARYTNGDRCRATKDGGLLEHGSVAWFIDRKGRVLRGRAFYSLNDRWAIQVGRFGVTFASAFEMFTAPPPELRRKRNEEARRKQLEREIGRAVRGEDFERAALLKRIAFGSEPVYRIWSRKNDCYYGPQYCGYTADMTFAGRYTREEAEAEVLRVPHILSLVTPAGKHLRAEDFAAPSILMAAE
ncbi:hypothetical protein MPPM_2609 [Methylorubrum populi]|uniref:Uncharacterized protein n=2 Tax=Methylorubrum populi TaxID=223967 RepID=A0A160PF19_9HYPH|nr:hypothetical protein MPPM_2609 [Methylorubrum populi]